MKTCMFADFYKQEFGWDCFQNDFGFIFYYININQDHDIAECYIPALYIRPEHRKSIEAKKLFTKVVETAVDHGCDFITAQIAIGENREESSTRILKCYLAMGFKIVNADKVQILVKYDLNETREV